jgi:hypothetical protein
MDISGEYVTTPTVMADRQQRKLRSTQYGALVVSTERQDGTVSTAGTAADPNYTQTGYLPAGTDRSGTAGTASAQLAAANAQRRGLNIQNISANTIGINEFAGTAAIGTAGTYTLNAGSSINVRTNRQVNVIASAAASAYTATEF